MCSDNTVSRFTRQFIGPAKLTSKMFAKLALFSVLVSLAVSSPTPGGHYKHIKIHVPYEVHTIHHHHEKKIHVPVHVPVVKEVKVIKEVPVVKEVPVIKYVHVPVVKHVPVYKTVEVEKLVHVPVHVEEHKELKGWDSESFHGWN